MLLFLIRPGSSPWQIMVLGMVMGFGVSGPGLAPHTMLGDVADTARLAFGERSDGTIGGAVNFISTVSQAVGISAAMAILGAFGFVHADRVRPCWPSPRTEQTAIRVLMSANPLVLMGLGSSSPSLQDQRRPSMNRSKTPSCARTAGGFDDRDLGVMKKKRAGKHETKRPGRILYCLLGGILALCRA
jgi:MFS family permease